MLISLLVVRSLVVDCLSLFLCVLLLYFVFVFFFFNDTATTEIYTLSLHDALPIFVVIFFLFSGRSSLHASDRTVLGTRTRQDRKSTRLNSSHSQISYAVFCLKKKKKKKTKT